MRTRTLLFGLCAVVIGALGCKGDGASGSSADLPPIPAAHDPKGEDLVEGAVLAAIEGPGSVGAGKYRLLKIVHVDDFPLPLDYEFHMIAYEPKSDTWEEAARMWKNKQVKVTIDHFIVRKVDFMTRDYRVLFREPITPEEQKPYDRSKITQVPQR